MNAWRTVPLLALLLGCNAILDLDEAHVDPTPASTGGTVGGFPLPPFPGCCREETGQCGYLVTDIGGLLPFAPGCVDATPFLNGADPVACGAGAVPGGAAGAGGVPSTSEGGASAGGVPNDGGASPAAGNSGLAGDPGAGGGDPFER